MIYKICRLKNLKYATSISDYFWLSSSFFGLKTKFIHSSSCLSLFKDWKVVNKQHANMESDLLMDKVAIITGGCGGIGMACAKAMLRNCLKAVTIADLNTCKGEIAVEELCKEFGSNKASFVECNVTNSLLFDWAFKHTLKKFKRVDILVNCAGIFNEKEWESVIEVNLNGYIIGCLLGLQYMSSIYRGKGGTIVNVSSILSLEQYCGCPIFTTTQHGILGLTRALGFSDYCKSRDVKVMSLCPGFTKTDLTRHVVKQCINERFSAEFKKELEHVKFQDPCYVGKGLVKMLACGKSASIWVVEDEKEPVEVAIPDLGKLLNQC